MWDIKLQYIYAKKKMYGFKMCSSSIIWSDSSLYKLEQKLWNPLG